MKNTGPQIGGAYEKCGSTVPWPKNSKVDALVRIAATLLIREIVMLPVYIQSQSSITSEPICSTAKADLGWMHDIVKYLQTGELPEDGKHAHKVHVQAFRFTLIIDSLNRRSFRGPYLRCLSDPKAQYVLAKLHKGVCGNHLGRRTLAHHAHTQGYYWPTDYYPKSAILRL